MKVDKKDVSFVQQDENEVHGKIHIQDLGPLFVKSKNVRDTEFGYDETNFCHKLADDGKVFEAVHGHMDGTTPEEMLKITSYAKLVEFVKKHFDPLKGFRRANCFYKVFKNPEQFPGEIDPLVSVVFKFGMSQSGKLQYKLDHSQNRGLNDYELGLCIEEELDSGVPRRNKDIVWEHLALFMQATTSAERQKYENRMQERPKLADPRRDLENRKDVAFDFFKGRFQFLQRTFTGPNREVLKENFRAKVYGLQDKLVVKITQKELTDIWDENDPNVFNEKWAALKEATIKESEAKMEPSYRWTKKTYKEKRDAFTVSDYFREIIDGIFGEKECQLKFTKMRDELVKIEKKMKEDPDAFWKFIEG